MTREATSVEATVNGLNLDSNGVAWAQIQYYEPPPAAVGEPGGAVATVNSDYYSINIRADRLPGVKLGDKVQVALYLK